MWVGEDPRRRFLWTFCRQKVQKILRKNSFNCDVRRERITSLIAKRKPHAVEEKIRMPGGSFWEGFCCQKASRNHVENHVGRESDTSTNAEKSPTQWTRNTHPPGGSFWEGFCCQKCKEEFEKKFIQLRSTEGRNYFNNSR